MLKAERMINQLLFTSLLEIWFPNNNFREFLDIQFIKDYHK